MYGLPVVIVRSGRTSVHRNCIQLLDDPLDISKHKNGHAQFMLDPPPTHMPIGTMIDRPSNAGLGLAT